MISYFFTGLNKMSKSTITTLLKVCNNAKEKNIHVVAERNNKLKGYSCLQLWSSSLERSNWLNTANDGGWTQGVWCLRPLQHKAPPMGGA